MNYYTEIKNELVNNEIYKRVKDYSKNRNDLSTYYNVGKLLVEAGKHYGEGIIKKYSEKLTSDLGQGYGISNLKRMRKYYYMIEKGVAVPHQLTWSHILALLPLSNINEINYYIRISVNKNLGYRSLREKIKNKEYQRLDDSLKQRLINNENIDIADELKNPIVIKSKNSGIEVSEKMLKSLILENIGIFLEELGEGYLFIKDEYKIKIGNSYNYIDLLLFNIKYNCYVVIELKVTSLKKQHLGQIDLYMNFIDQNIKDITHNKTIGIIIVKENNKFVIKYCSNENIFSTEYKLINI